MRIRQVFPVVCAAAIVPLLYVLFPKTEEAESIRENASWHPTAEEISAEVGVGTAGDYTDERHHKFAQLFQKRYRNQQHAVGVRFTDKDRIRAMFAPVIPRWDMARISIAVESEARKAFGRPYVVDIYETYITAPMKKLAECHTDPATGKSTVDFDQKYLSVAPPAGWMVRRMQLNSVQIFYRLLPLPEVNQKSRPLRPMEVPSAMVSFNPRRSP